MSRPRAHIERVMVFCPTCEMGGRDLLNAKISFRWSRMTRDRPPRKIPVVTGECGTCRYYMTIYPSEIDAGESIEA
jgi:hypothetical protein